jgi:undecaprenyl-diphosphatase
MSNVGYRTFLPWNVAGVLGCVGGTVLVGYAAGRSYATVSDIFGRATGALLWLILVIVGLVLIGRYLGRNPDPVAALGTRLAGWTPLRFVGQAYRAGFDWLTARVGVGGAVAVNVLGGVLVLFAVGYALTWTIDSLVSGSGLPLVDPPVLRWMAGQRDPVATRAAEATLSALRGTYLILLVGIVAVLLTWRSQVWRADLVGVLGSGGAFVPLVLIALATDWERGPAVGPPVAHFANQSAMVATSVGILAWLVSRQLGWGGGVAAWTTAITIAVVVDAARIYLGWSLPSETVASTLLGGLWVLVFVIAWRTRDGIRAAQESVEV